MNDLDSCSCCGPCQRCEAIEREKARKPTPRPLKIQWTEEMAADAKAFHSDLPACKCGCREMEHSPRGLECYSCDCKGFRPASYT